MHAAKILTYFIEQEQGGPAQADDGQQANVPAAAEQVLAAFHAADHTGRETHDQVASEAGPDHTCLARTIHQERLTPCMPHRHLQAVHAGRVDGHEEDRTEVLLQHPDIPGAEFRPGPGEGGQEDEAKPLRATAIGAAGHHLNTGVGNSAAG